MFFPLHQDYFDEDDEDEDEEKEKVIDSKTTTAVLLSLHAVLAMSIKESCVIQCCCPACIDVVADSVTTNP